MLKANHNEVVLKEDLILQSNCVWNTDLHPGFSEVKESRGRSLRNEKEKKNRALEGKGLSVRERMDCID